MGTKAIEPDKFNEAIVAIINRERAARGWSYRTLADNAGLGRSRVFYLVSNQRPIYIDELDSICDALGLVAWRVVREAEQNLALDQSVATQDELTLAADIQDIDPLDEAEAEERSI